MKLPHVAWYVFVLEMGIPHKINTYKLNFVIGFKSLSYGTENKGNGVHWIGKTEKFYSDTLNGRGPNLPI